MFQNLSNHKDTFLLLVQSTPSSVIWKLEAIFAVVLAALVLANGLDFDTINL